MHRDLGQSVADWNDLREYASLMKGFFNPKEAESLLVLWEQYGAFLRHEPVQFDPKAVESLHMHAELSLKRANELRNASEALQPRVAEDRRVGEALMRVWEEITSAERGPQ